jgi:hypothetical protein
MWSSDKQPSVSPKDERRRPDLSTSVLAGDFLSHPAQRKSITCGLNRNELVMNRQVFYSRMTEK